MAPAVSKEEMQLSLTAFTYFQKKIPVYMHEGIIRYFCDGIIPGDFLLAVLENDFRKACNHADDVNLWILPVYCAFLHNCAPTGSWGSLNNIRMWIEPFKLAREAVNQEGTS